jgi:hypothetical protein
VGERVLSDLLLVGAGTRVDVAHEEGGRDAAGEVGLVGSEADDLRGGRSTRGMMKLLISLSE